MRQELKLTSYTVQAVVWHCLRERIPEFDCHLLAAWYHGHPTTASWQRAEDDCTDVTDADAAGARHSRAAVVGPAVDKGQVEVQSYQ